MGSEGFLIAGGRRKRMLWAFMFNQWPILTISFLKILLMLLFEWKQRQEWVRHWRWQGNYLVLRIICGAWMSLSSHWSPKLCFFMASSTHTHWLLALPLPWKRILPQITVAFLWPHIVGSLESQLLQHPDLRKPKATVEPLLGLFFSFRESLAYKREGVGFDYSAFK